MIEGLLKMIFGRKKKRFPKKKSCFVIKFKLQSGFKIEIVIKNLIPSMITWQIFLRPSRENFKPIAPAVSQKFLH